MAAEGGRLAGYRIEILANALTAITEEIQLTILRSAYSHNVKEGHDASCAIFTRAGQIVTQPVAIPGHLGSMKFMLEEVLKSFPLSGMTSGDVYITNDPYRGGSHLPDIGLFRPLFHGGECVAFTGCIIHHTDVGGMVPGSNPVRATELYQEGLIIPPSKLWDGGRENVTLISILRANVRQPEITLGDLHAQEAAMLKGEQRLQQLFDRYGYDSVTEAMEQLIEYSEKKAREAISKIPNGTYEFEDFMDHDGIDLDKPIRIKVKLEVRDDSLFFDFTGTDPQVRGPINAPLAKTWTSTFYCVSCVMPQGVMFNEGTTRVIDIHVPEGTILNPRHPAPVNARTVTLQRVVDAVHGVLAQAAPDLVGAQCSGTTAGVSFGGIDPRTGKNFVFYEAFCGGMGATRSGDGTDGVSTGTSNPQLISAEAVELAYPVRIHRVELVEDSGGYGQFRGGLGIRREYEMLADSATMNVRSERSKFTPHGLDGGGPGNLSINEFAEGTGPFRQLASKFSGRIKKGDRLAISTPGAGGYGDPAGRDPKALRDDWLDQKQSAGRIQTCYGVDVTRTTSADEERGKRPDDSQGF